MDHTGFAPTQGVCAFPVYTAQAPGCSAGDQPPNVGPAFRALPRSKLPGFSFSSTPQTHRQWSMCFVPFPGPSSSGDQVLGEHAIPGGLCVLITSPVPAPWFPGCTARAVSQVSHISPPGSDPPGRCQPSQMPGRLGQQLEACSQIGGRCHLWGQDCPLLSGSGCHPPASLPLVGEWTALQLASSPLVFAQSFVL